MTVRKDDHRVTQAPALLRSLPAAELRRLAGQCAALGRGPLRGGRPSYGLFIGEEGSIEIRQTSLRGHEEVFPSEGPGATLGDGPLFDRRGYIATAITSAGRAVNRAGGARGVT